MIDKIRELLFKLFKKDSFIGKLINKFVTKEFISYVLFGVLTTILNFAVYIGFHELFLAIGWEGLLHGILPDNEFIRQLFEGEDPCYLDANTIAWVAGVVFAFVTNKLWVFESKSWKPAIALKEFISFTGARIFSFVVETVMMFVLVTLMHCPAIIAKLIIGIVVIILNYIFSKLFIFKKKA
ncbi:MAG: GtrA family protein [Acutalibacteraceae bacterium]|nr:GtrA family protein [Acutalibacteraceae bacterium]